MSTLTSQRRHAFPARYARKDARRAIYAALYGPSEGHDPQATPSLNPNRKLPQHWRYADAKETWNNLHDLAEFPSATEAALLRRLEALQRYKPEAQP